MDLRTRDISVYIHLDTQENITKVRLGCTCAVTILFTNACMHLHRFRFGLVSYVSKRRLMTCESSYTRCVQVEFEVSFIVIKLLACRLEPFYFVFLWSALVQGKCFPLGDLLSALKTDQTLKLRFHRKVSWPRKKNCTGNSKILVSI